MMFECAVKDAKNFAKANPATFQELCGEIADSAPASIGSGVVFTFSTGAPSPAAPFLSPNNEKPAKVCYLCGSPLEIPAIAGKHAFCSRACLEDYAA
jgi:hypothetical protein